MNSYDFPVRDVHDEMLKKLQTSTPYDLDDLSDMKSNPDIARHYFDAWQNEGYPVDTNQFDKYGRVTAFWEKSKRLIYSGERVIPETEKSQWISFVQRRCNYNWNIIRNEMATMQRIQAMNMYHELTYGHLI